MHIYNARTLVPLCIYGSLCLSDSGRRAEFVTVHRNLVKHKFSRILPCNNKSHLRYNDQEWHNLHDQNADPLIMQPCTVRTLRSTSNPAKGMDMCLRFFVLSYVSRSIASKPMHLFIYVTESMNSNFKPLNVMCERACN